MLDKCLTLVLLACFVAGLARHIIAGHLDYCDKDYPNCSHQNMFCAPPDNKTSQWVYYECLCSKADECYRENGVTKCQCTGHEGFGEYCNETNCNPDHCSSVGGVCNPENNTCACFTDYWGTYCENQYLPCNDNPDLCNDNGNCRDLDGKDQYDCECFNGWNGDHCENNIDHRHLFRRNYPTHHVRSNDYQYIDDCLSNPCKHGGTCYHDNNGFFCKCRPAYRGVYCDIRPVGRGRHRDRK